MKSSLITKIMTSTSAMAVLGMTTTAALAGTAPPVGNIPEPGSLALFGLGGVVLVAGIIRNRRNKKK